jgi:hypothetical protein
VPSLPEPSTVPTPFMSVQQQTCPSWATLCLPSAVMSAASQRGPTVNYHNAAVRSSPLLQRARAGEPCSKTLSCWASSERQVEPEPASADWSSTRGRDFSQPPDAGHALIYSTRASLTCLESSAVLTCGPPPIVCGGRLARLHVSQTSD